MFKGVIKKNNKWLLKELTEYIYNPQNIEKEIYKHDNRKIEKY